MLAEIRRENMGQLVKEFGGNKELGEVIEKSEAQVGQWVVGSKDSKTGKRRGMRDDTCRWIEEKTGKPKGWLDIDHSAQIETNIAPTFEGAIRLLTLYASVSPSAQEMILGFAENMALADR